MKFLMIGLFLFESTSFAETFCQLPLKSTVTSLRDITFLANGEYTLAGANCTYRYNASAESRVLRGDRKFVVVLIENQGNSCQAFLADQFNSGPLLKLDCYDLEVSELNQNSYFKIVSAKPVEFP